MTAFEKVLITGASSGLGRSIALELARQGTKKLVLVARRAALLESLSHEVRQLGADAETCALDVADTDAVIRFVQEEDEAHGGFDLVLANAGVGFARPAAELEWADVRSVLDVNVNGAIATLWAAMGPMIRRGRGTLAGMSSLASQRGLPQSGSYSASKAALSTWLETLQLDLARTGVRVVDIRPGFVRTPMTDHNRHPMPFMVDLDRATKRCVRDLERGKAVCSFPWPMVWAVWGARRMPDRMYGFLARLWRS